MEIKSLVERDDGGADIEVDLTKEEHIAMVQLGILTSIQLGMEELGDQSEGETE